MTATPTPETYVSATVVETDPIDDDVLEKRLLKQLTIAVVILAGLMSSLLIFDRLNAPPPASVVVPPPDPEPLATAKEPMAAEPAANDTTRDAVKPPSEEANKSVPPLAGEGETIPEGTGAPQTVTPRLRSGEKPLTKPATSRLAMLHPAESSPTVPSRPEPARELAKSKPSPSVPAVTQPAPEPQAASRPLTQAARNFGLQLGVFGNPANAEELRAKLTQNGIPATIEARVHAGPFASRAEADLARAKLKQMGITDSLLISMKNRGAP